MNLHSKIERILSVLAPIMVCGCGIDESGTALTCAICFEVGEKIVSKVTESTVDVLITDGFRVSSPGLMDNYLTQFSGGVFKTDVFWPGGIEELDFFSVYPPSLELSRSDEGSYSFAVGTPAEVFSCGTDVLTAVAFAATEEDVPVPMDFNHPLSYLSSVYCALSDKTPEYYSVLVDDILVAGVPEYGTLEFPTTSSGLFKWTCNGSREVDYCTGVSHMCADKTLKAVCGNPLMMIPTEDGKYRMTVRYHLCIDGVPERVQSSASAEITLSPGMRGTVNLIFKPESGSCGLTFGIALDPWNSDEKYDYTIKLN